MYSKVGYVVAIMALCVILALLYTVMRGAAMLLSTIR